MTDRQKIKSIFDQLKHDPNHHLGLGDIRLTIGQQDEIINLFPETTTPQNTISPDRQKAEEMLMAIENKDHIRGYWVYYEEDVLRAMERYAKYLHAQQVEAVTDEEIEKQYPINSHHQMDTDSWNNKLKQEGAKWLRSRIKG